MVGTKFNVKIIGILFDPKERKFLVGKNKGEEYFSFIDGELKYDEELDVGLKRVVIEKTGYEVHNLGTIFARNRIDNQDTDMLELYFLCELKEGEEILGEIVEEIRWIKDHEFEGLTNQKLPPRLKEYINNICG
jgi:ADP-ribose pyrophosphatase YjhB (NUDIX family)